MFLHLRRCGLCCGIVGHEHFLFGLGQNGGDQTMMFQHGFIRQRIGVFLHLENLCHLFAHGLGYGFGLILPDGLTFHSYAHSGGRDPGSFRNGGPGFFVFLQPFGKVDFGSSRATTNTESRLSQVFVKCVQVLGPEVCQLDMTDGGVDAKTSPVAAAYGSNLQVAGTAVFRHPEGMAKAVEIIHNSTAVLDSNI